MISLDEHYIMVLVIIRYIGSHRLRQPKQVKLSHKGVNEPQKGEVKQLLL